MYCNFEAGLHCRSYAHAYMHKDDEPRLRKCGSGWKHQADKSGCILRDPRYRVLIRMIHSKSASASFEGASTSYLNLHLVDTTPWITTITTLIIPGRR